MNEREYLEYQLACTEVLEVIKNMPKKDSQKIPQNVIKSLRSAKRFDYKFRYDTSKKATEQKISNKAKSILNGLYRDYIVSDKIRMLMMSKEKFDKKKKEAVDK